MDISDAAELLELRAALKGPERENILEALSLAESVYASLALLEVLTLVAAPVLRRAESRLRCSLALIVFGSLGRLEFDRARSDIDPLVLFDRRSGSRASADQVRDEIVPALAKAAPWLPLDHSTELRRGRIHALTNLDTKYPVLDVAALRDEETPYVRRRRWQLWLESACIGGQTLYATTVRDTLPVVAGKSRAPSGREPALRLDVSTMLSEIGEYFVEFENPALLYKTPYKYFKARFLREYYQFASLLALLAIYFRQKEAVIDAPTLLRGPTLLKLLRASVFSFDLDRKLTARPSLTADHQSALTKITQAAGVPFSSSDGSSALTSQAAVFLERILAALTVRFAEVRTRLYDDAVSTHLSCLPVDTNFDARFLPHIQSVAARNCVIELLDRRSTYLRLMAAFSQAYRLLYLPATPWGGATAPKWLDQALHSFEKPPPSSGPR